MDKGGPVVRAAVLDDLDAITRLEYDSFPEDRVSRRSLRYFLTAPHRPVLVATIDNEIAGYALVALRKGGRAALFPGLPASQGRRLRPASAKLRVRGFVTAYVREQRP